MNNKKISIVLGVLGSLMFVGGLGSYAASTQTIYKGAIPSFGTFGSASVLNFDDSATTATSGEQQKSTSESASTATLPTISSEPAASSIETQPAPRKVRRPTRPSTDSTNISDTPTTSFVPEYSFSPEASLPAPVLISRDGTLEQHAGTCEAAGTFTYRGEDTPQILNGMCLPCPMNTFIAQGGTCNTSKPIYVSK